MEDISNQIKGLESKLSKITRIWNDYFLKEEYCQSKINFNDEAKTNYFAEILHYFNDTFKSIIAYSTYYSKNLMNYVTDNIEKSKRYGDFLEIFFKECLFSIDGRIKHITEVQEKKEKNEEKVNIDLNIKFTDKKTIISDEEKDGTHYYMSKLSEMKHLYMIDLMLDKYQQEQKIKKYLNELKEFADDQKEYRISYELLRRELVIKGYLKSY
ncbi:MAG: hypothetical protein ACLKAN_13355 [Alkaliphilus sp.]